jgi:hypothetical protein
MDEIDILRMMDKNATMTKHSIVTNRVRVLCLGLCASDFVFVVQYLGDARVPPIALTTLIVAIPALAVAGTFAEVVGRSHPKEDSQTNTPLLAGFGLGTLFTAAGFGKAFYAFNHDFCYAWIGGIIFGLILCGRVLYLFKEEGL